MAAQILDHSPDTILYNGKIVCVEKDFSVAKAVAIKNGRFTGVGKDKDILNLAGPRTRKLDLEGRTVLPGLIDSHNHMTQVGLDMQGFSLEGSECIDDIVKVIGEKVRETEPRKWIATSLIGEPAISHQLKERRLPTRWDLDPVSPDHPVCIGSFHLLIVNSCALKAAGIDRNTAQPDGGTIGMDPDTGEPTGILHEEPAMSLIRPFLPVPTYEDNVHGLQKACRRYNALGLTSICQHGLDFNELRSYQDLWRRKELSVRSYVHLWVDPEQSLEETERMIKELSFIASPGFGDEYLKIGGLKVIFDGGVGIGTALMREPYTTSWGELSHGMQVIATDKFLELARLCNTYDLRLAQHDSGGKAIDIVLDVYSRVDSEKTIRDKRFTMVHCQFPTKENFEQIRRLGVVIPTQTVFLYTAGMGYVKYLGNELADTALPLRDWMDSGLPVALGSDAPVNSFNPLLGIWHAVTRKEKTMGQVIGPDQRITREEAIRCYTLNGAYISFEEHLKGSIEPGKLADLVVLDNDILTCPVDEIKDTKVLMTMLGGKIVFESV